MGVRLGLTMEGRSGRVVRRRDEVVHTAFAAQVLRDETRRAAPAGKCLGLGLALSAMAAAQSLLFGVEAREPWLMALIVVVLGGSGLAAAALPTHRALRTDPVSALRIE
jgi:hypothetical protein